MRMTKGMSLTTDDIDGTAKVENQAPTAKHTILWQESRLTSTVAMSELFLLTSDNLEY